MQTLRLTLFLTLFFTALLNQAYAFQLPLVDNSPVEKAKQIQKLIQDGEAEKLWPMLDSASQAAISKDLLGMIWQQVEAQAGQFMGIKGHKIEQLQGLTIVVLNNQFANTWLDVKIGFNTAGKVAGFRFLPGEEPNKPLANEATFFEAKHPVVNGTFTLGGRLTLPKNAESPPLFIMFQGSGPHNMDEAIGPNRIFEQVAHGLAQQGIATLRYHKRTYAYSTSMGDSLTIFTEGINDGIAAVRQIIGNDSLQFSGIYLLGHSQGGMFIPSIAKACPQVKGLIMMAAVARPLQTLVVEQVNYFAARDSVTAEEQARIDLIEQKAQVIDNKAYAGKEVSELLLNLPAGYWQSIDNTPWVTITKKLKKPVLVLQGLRDCQVTMDDYMVWQKALKKKATYHQYPTLNHLFLPGQGPSYPDEYNQPGQIPEAFFTDISSWLNSLK